jgi:hypothetical protein
MWLVALSLLLLSVDALGVRSISLLFAPFALHSGAPLGWLTKEVKNGPWWWRRKGKQFIFVDCFASINFLCSNKYPSQVCNFCADYNWAAVGKSIDIDPEQ